MRRSKQRIRKPRTTNGHTGTMKIYGSYIFRAKDPAIDALRTLIEDHYGKRVNSRGVLSDIEQQGGPTLSCMRSWFFGETRRPQNPTLEAAGRAMGYERRWHRMRPNK